jgi:sugar fermentation stimulation protein A
VVIAEALIEGRLIRRYARFLMDLKMPGGSVLTVHCPNSGSMEGCLETGALVLASRSNNPERRYAYTAEWIRLEAGWCGINTHRTNLIAGEALRGRRVPGLEEYAEVRSEVPYGKNSRADFLLTADGHPPCYVEVKNTTWPTPEGGVGFPDAVTDRGLKHLSELRRAKREGARAVMLFLVNRQDGTHFRAAGEKDPAYARALAASVRAGVEAMALRVKIDPPEAVLAEPLPTVRKCRETLKPLAP